MQQLYQTTLPVQQQQQQLPQIFSQQQQQPAPIMQQHAAQYLPPQLSPAPLQTLPSAQQDLMYQQQHQLYNSGNTTFAQMQQQQHYMQPTTTLPNQPHSVPQNQYQQQQQEQRYVARPNSDGSLQLVAVYDGNPANNSHQPSSSPATHHTIYQGPPATQVTTGATNNNSSWYANSSASTQHQPQYYLQHPQQQQQTFVVSPTSTIPMGTAGLPRNVGPVGTPISTAPQQQFHLHPGHQQHHYHHQTHLPPQALYAPLSQPQQPLQINAAAPSIIPSVYQQQHQQQVVMAPQQQQQPMARAPSGPFEVAPPPPPPQQHTQPFVYHTTASSSSAAIAAQQQHNMMATNNNNNKTKNGHGLEEGKVYHGVVKRYNPTRGFGFLRTDDGVDVFVHQSCVNMCGFRALNVGARVVFSAGVVMGTLQAMDVSQETPYVPGGGGFEGPSSGTTVAPTQHPVSGATNSSTSDASSATPLVAAGGLLGIAPSTAGNHALPSTSIIGKEHESLSLSESERARLLASFHLEDHSSSKGTLQHAPATANTAGPASIVILTQAPSTNNHLMPTQLRLPSLCGAAAATALPMSPTGEFSGIPMFSSPATTRVASPHNVSYLSEFPLAQQQQPQNAAYESGNASALFASGLLSTHALPTSFVSTATTFAVQATKQLPDDESEDPTNPLDRTGSSFAPSLLLSTASSAGNLQSVSRFMSGRSDTAEFLLQVQNPGFSTVQLAFGGNSSS